MNFQVNLNQLYTFYIITKLQSFKEAASYLNLSAAAVSIQVKNLEQFIGFELFVKKVTRIELTEKGKSLLPTIEKIFYNVEVFNKKILSYQHENENKIIIAINSTPGEVLVPLIYNYVNFHLPEVRILFADGSYDELLNKLREKEISCFIKANDFSYPDIKSQKFIEFEVPFVVSAKNPLAKKKYLQLKDLEKTPILLSPLDSSFSWHIHNFFIENDIPKPPSVAVLSSNFDKSFVMNTEYGAFMNSTLITKELERGDLVEIELEKQPSNLNYYIGYLEESLQNQHMVYLLESLQSINKLSDLEITSS